MTLTCASRSSEPSTNATPTPLWWPADPAAWVSGSGELGSWVADVQGQVIGHVQLHTAEGAPVRLWERGTGIGAEGLVVVGRLFVDPGHRRGGVGSALLYVAVGAARRHGLQPVLDVLLRNKVACEMYEASGWRNLGQFSWEWASGSEPAYAYALP